MLAQSVCFNSGARPPISSAIDDTHTHDSSASDLGRVSVVEMAVSRLPAAGKTVSAGVPEGAKSCIYSREEQRDGPRRVWREQLDYVAFAAAVNANMRGPRRQHRPLQAIGLVTESQILTLEPRPESMFCLTSLLEKFVEVDATASALGVCGA